jgi:hypothetical protein
MNTNKRRDILYQPISPKKKNFVPVLRENAFYTLSSLASQDLKSNKQITRLHPGIFAHAAISSNRHPACNVYFPQKHPQTTMDADPMHDMQIPARKQQYLVDFAFRRSQEMVYLLHALGWLAAVSTRAGLGCGSLSGRQLLGAGTIGESCLIGLDVDDLSSTCGISLGSGEELSTFQKSSLVVLTRVDKVGVVQGQLNGTVHNVISSFDTEHEGMILVADLVAPAAETTSGVDIFSLKLGEKFLENALTLERRSGVTVVKAAVVGGDDFVLGFNHLSVDKTLD